MRKRSIVLALAAVAAAVFLFATYGTALPQAPFSPVAISGPLAADFDGQMGAVADTESRRVLILNAEGELTGVVDCTTFDSPIEAVNDVCVSDGRVFVSGAKYAPDSNEAERLRVAEYDKGGNLKGTIIDLEAGDSNGMKPMGLSEADDGIVLAVAKLGTLSDKTGAGTVMQFFLANGEGSREVAHVDEGIIALHDVGFCAKTGNYATLSTRGMINDSDSNAFLQFADRTFTSIDLDDSGRLYACDDESGALCVIARDGSVHELMEGHDFEAVHTNGNVISACEYDENRVAFCDADGNVLADFTSVKPSLGYSLRMVLVYVCSAYLALLVIVLLVRRARKAIISGETSSIGPMLASAAVVIAVGAAVGMLSYSSYQSSIDTRMREVSMSADYLSSTANSISNAMEKCDDRSKLRLSEDPDVTTSFLDVSSHALYLTNAANENGIGIYFVIYGKDDQGIFYLVDSDSDYVTGSSVPASNSEAIAVAFDERSGYGGEVHQGRSRTDATSYRLVSIPSSDMQSVVGVIEVGTKVRAFDASVSASLAEQLLALLVVMLVVFLVYSELRACGTCLLSYRQMQQRRERDAIAMLTRPFTFAITLLSSIDAIMTVLIARELLTKAGMDGSSPLLALPAVMLGLGLVIGQSAFGALSSRVGLRRLMAGGALAMLVCSGFTIAAVAWGGFWQYCVAKLALSVPFGLLYSLGYSMPRIAESPETRAAAAGGVKCTDTSAAALGTVLGGYAAQTLGNAWVYVIVGVVALLVVVMTLNLLPKGAKPLEGARPARQAVSDLMRFVRSRQALSIALLIVLPATVAAGYTSFLFPLFSYDLGLSKTEINNIFVIGQLVVYVCINGIEAQEDRFGKWRVSLVALALLGAVFLLFSLNTTLVWSIAVVAIVALLCKSTDGWKAIWLSCADRAGVQPGHATGAMFAVRSLALVAQPFILGGLLTMTASFGVIAIGAFCVVCAVFFFFLTRRSALPDMR